MHTKLSTFAALAAISAPLLAQNHYEVTFAIDTNPPADDTLLTGQWHAAPLPGDPIFEADLIRIRVDGWEGGWTRPVVDFFVETETEGMPQWLLQTSPASSLAVQFHGPTLDQTQYQDPIYDVPNLDTFQRWTDFITLSGGQTLTGNGVHSWCQPFLTPIEPSNDIDPSSVLWVASWSGWTSSSGQVHSNLWRKLLTSRDKTSTFAGASLLRYAIVEQATYCAPGGGSAAASFFQSSAWTESVENAQLQLSLQMIAIRGAALPSGIVVTNSNASLAIEPMPLVGVSHASKFIVRSALELLPRTHGLVGVVLTPGQSHTFECPKGTSPLLVSFMTSAGTRAVEEAVPTPTLFNPSAYTVTVPTDYVAGDILLQSGLMSSFQLVGCTLVQ